MNPQEKMMLLGAFGDGVADLAVEAVYASNPAEWEGKFPFVSPLEPVPPYDDLIVGLAVPGVLALLGKLLRSRKVMDVAKGAACYGIPMTVGLTIQNVIKMACSPGQFNISYEFPTTNIIRQASWLDRQRVTESHHSGEFLPFQTDVTY